MEALTTKAIAIAEQYLSRVCVQTAHRPIPIHLLAACYDLGIVHQSGAKPSLVGGPRVHDVVAVCVDRSASHAQQHRDLACALALDAIKIAREPFNESLAVEVANHLHANSLPRDLGRTIDVEAEAAE